MNIVLTTVASNNIYADNGPATSKQTKKPQVGAVTV